MSKTCLSATVSVLALLVGATGAWAQDAQTPAAGQGTTATGEPYPGEQVPVTTPVQPEEAAAAAAADEEAEVDEVVVTGLRRSLESAASIKRRSDAIVDAIVAEDIGKLPDTFASAALARAPGVQVTRGAGEAAGVQVRGLPDISTTYNGREIFTAEGRFVQIQDFPAGTVSALEVFKSSTANLIEGGIGGQVNVRGRRPFDFRGFELSGSLNAVAWEQSDKKSFNGNLLVSDRWDTGAGEMGFLVNASYVGINFLDSTREQALVIGTTNAGQGVTPGVRFPDAQAQFYGGGDRYRPSLNASFQWRPNSELEVYVDALFQGYRGKDENRFLFVPIFGGDMQLSNLVTRPGTTDQALSMTVTNAVRPDGFYGSANGHTDTYQFGGGAVWRRDALTISGDLAVTDSTYDFTLFNVDFAFASSPVRNVNFDAGDDGGPSYEFVNFDLTDPDNFISRGLYQQRIAVSGHDVQARTDLSYDLDRGLLKRFQFGFRFNDRDATRDFGDSYVNNEGAGIPLADLPVTLNLTNSGFDFDDTHPVRTFVAIPSTSIRDNMQALRAFYGQPSGLPGYNPTENFVANEKAYATYGQLKYGFDVGATVVDGLVGLRAVRTETEIDGFQRILSPTGESFQEITRENGYWDYLPNISARIAFSPELQLRLAYTKTRTRPGFFDLRSSTTVNQENESQSPIVLPDGTETTDYRTASGGNPDLQPLTSDNYDLSLEWYFSRSGSLTGALFRRDANGFVFNDVQTVPDPVYNYLRISQPVNSGETRFQGAEVSFTSFLDLPGLPEWAKGFGIQANGTYIDSEGDLSPRFNDLLNNQPMPFPGVSEWAGNLVALYEKPTFSARLAYNYRSDFVVYYSEEAFDVGPSLSGSGAIEPRVRGVTERGRGQLDFSTTFTPRPNITIAFDIVNVLGNPLQRFRQFRDDGATYERQIIYLERTYSLGTRFRF